MGETVTIPAAHGRAFKLSAGEAAKITSIEGSQVVDCWAFALPDLTEFFSAEHTRTAIEKLVPTEGDQLYSNRRRPILTIVEDASPGVHDILLSACDPSRYTVLGHEGYHRNCVENMRDGLAEFGLEPPEVPSPINIFEQVGIGPGGTLAIEPPPVQAGDSITLRAERDLVLALSSCPMDIALTNGPDRRAKPIGVEILAAQS